jgi:hypothetical protein
MRAALPFVTCALLCLAPLAALAEETPAQAPPNPAARPAPRARTVDVGGRFAFQRSFGAYDRGTRPTDLSFGEVPLSLDVTVHIPKSEGSPWAFEVGALGTYAPTVPTLCAGTSECISSIGHDWELILLARVRAPRTWFFWPELEIGPGWSWSSRKLVDKDTTSTRRWNGPVLVRAALIPTVRLGERTRLGLVLGGSIARSSSFSIEAPGVDRTGSIDSSRLHGTVDLGLRLGVDFGR